jgi:ABC-2 type transport system permease protein
MTMFPRRFFRRVLALAAKETTHVRRDPRSLYMALGMPLVMILLFGFGVSFDREALPLALVDQDQTAASRRLAEVMVASNEFVIVERVADADRAEALFRQGIAEVALLIPPGFSEKLGRGDGASAQLLTDGSDPSGAQAALSRADALVQATGATLEAAPGAAPPIEARVWTRFNPTHLSAWFLVPGLVALILSMVTVMLTSLTIAREWERGSMEQLFATPVGRLEIILGKLLPYLGIGILQLLLVLLASRFVFHVPMRGSPLLLGFLSLLFLIGMLGQGLLLSIATKSQMLATQAGIMTTMLPSMLLSGFMYPIENMPRVLQLIAAAVPARYFIDALRGILLKGNGLSQLWSETLCLALFAVLMLCAAAAKFVRRLA